MPRKAKPVVNPKDPTFKQLGSGLGVSVTKEQMVSKIYSYRQEVLRLRNEWLKRMNDDTFTIESKFLKSINHFLPHEH